MIEQAQQLSGLSLVLSRLRLIARLGMGLLVLMLLPSCASFFPKPAPAPVRVRLVLAPPLSEACPQYVYQFVPGQQITADMAGKLALAEREAFKACAKRHARTLEKIREHNEGT